MLTTVFGLTLMLQTQPAEPWTWALYEGSPIVLAEEVPDTPKLRTTLECVPHSAVARLSLYIDEPSEGQVTVSAGNSSAVTQARREIDASVLAIRADHPVFTRFVAEGRMTIVIGGAERTVVVDRPHLPKLRRFAERCVE